MTIEEKPWRRPRPAQKAAGRSRADFEPLLPAETSLRSACRRGEFAWVGDSRPSEPTRDNRVRAGFLRFLLFGCAELADEYTTFSPLAYSLDLLLPLVDLQQERDWAPMLPTPPAERGGKDPVELSLANASADLGQRSLNHITRILMWFEIVFGWAGSLVLVAVLSGLARSHDEKA